MKTILSVFVISVFLAGCGKSNAKKELAGVGPVKQGPAPAGGTVGGGETGGGATGGGALLPLAVGHEWTYELTGEGTISWCSIPEGGTRSTKVVSFGKEGDVDLFTLEGSFCGATNPLKLAVDGDKVWSHAMGQKYLILDTPVDNGVHHIGNNEYRWTKLGSLTTKAGSFSDCWRTTLLNAPSTTYTDYCRGVGTVGYYLKQGEASVTVTLVKKNF